MRIKKLSILATIVFTLSMIGTHAFAGLELVEESTKTIGATTITWDSSFRDLDYTLGDTITMTVTWTVDSGAATFNNFALKRFTPSSQKDPATGELLGVTLINDSSGDNEGKVVVRFKFTGLHLDKKRNIEIGNAHFKLWLNIDKDGDGYPESVAGYGVNVHAEDPQ